MLCKKLHHAAFRCKDAKATVEFYTKVLGLKFAHAMGEDHVPSTGVYSPHIHIFFEMEDGAWDFKTREGFLAFAHATFVEWTRRLPPGETDAFITDVLDRYQTVAADNPAEPHTFKFYQLTVQLKA